MYNIMKLFAGTCMPETNETCMQIFQGGSERHEQYVRNVLLVTIIVMTTLAFALLLYLLNRRHKDESK